MVLLEFAAMAFTCSWFLLIAIRTRSAMLRVYVQSFSTWREHSLVFTVGESCSISIEFISERAAFSMALKKVFFSCSDNISLWLSTKSLRFCLIQDNKERIAFVCLPVLCTTWNFLLRSSEVRLYIAPSTLSRLSNNLVFLPIMSSQMLFIANVVASVNVPASAFFNCNSVWPGQTCVRNLDACIWETYRQARRYF